MEKNQKMIDDFLLNGVAPKRAQPGGFKELWEVMTPEQKEQAAKVWKQAVNNTRKSSKEECVVNKLPDHIKSTIKKKR